MRTYFEGEAFLNNFCYFICVGSSPWRADIHICVWGQQSHDGVEHSMGSWLCWAPADLWKADVPGISLSIYIYVYILCAQIAAQLWHTQGGPKCPGRALRAALPLPIEFSFLHALLGTADFGTWIPSDFRQAHLVCLEFVKGAKVWGEFLPWLKGTIGPIGCQLLLAAGGSTAALTHQQSFS